MNIDKLTTALTITFVVSVVVLFAELLFVLRRRRPPSSQPPNKYSPKELLYFFGLKSQTTRVEPSEPMTQKPDVFKLLEANAPSRVLCTIKEDDREEAESTTMSVVDSVQNLVTENVSLQVYESLVFFTPMGSPSEIV